MVGPSGSGKSTLVDAMINYVLGIEWQDSFRFKLGTEENATSRICSYTLHHSNGFRIPYSLTIIDTPGYNEHDEQNQNINCFITSFLEDEDDIHAICFVVSAAECQPMQCQKSFCDWIRSTFEEADNHVRLMTTFADGTIPLVVECCLRVGVPLVTDPTSGQCYYKFNNTATFADNAEESEDVAFRQTFWDMTTNTMTRFFQMIEVTTQTVCIKSIGAQTEQLAATEIASNEDNFSHVLREMGTFRSMIESVNLSRRNRPRRINLRNVRGALHPDISCDGCQSSVRGFRYKCIECADFDLCGRCEVMAKHSNHLVLRFSLLNEPSPLRHAMAFIVTPRNENPMSDQLDLENARGQVHVTVTCDGCLSHVYGFRYKCIECPDFDLCGECEALGKHPNHKMLRFSTPQVIY